LGDVLQISVWREPELSVPSVTVRPDGKISVPLLKEISVDGLSPSELEKRLTEKFRPVVHEPEVTVVVQQVNSKKVYLLGALRKEGTINLLRPMTVLQAIAEAGGFNEFAKTKRIYILRRQNGKQIRLAYDYQAVISGSDLTLDVVLQPDDTLVVPR
jgi:polysaccharide export outer membrane protein